MGQTVNYLVVGNTRLHWAESRNNDYKFSHTFKDDPLPPRINIDKLIWASVGKYPTRIFKKKNEITINDIYLKNSPKNFGIDRALCCIAALAICDNPMKKNLLIADFGTTLSITKINSKGDIIGGQIMPGFLTQLKSMEQATKNLNYPKKIIIPKNNFQLKTSKAMIKGVHNSLIGAINLSYNAKKDLLIICGGDAELMGKTLKKNHINLTIEPNLIMLGMLSFHKNKSNLSDV